MWRGAIFQVKRSIHFLALSMELFRRALFCCCRVFFFFFLIVPATSRAAGSGSYLGLAYLTCLHNTAHGTSLSSTFKSNLNTALHNLTSLSSTGTTYPITSAGSGDDMVYAMFQCCGDQTTQLCSECVANATVRLPQHDCPDSIGARIKLDGCYLRYDDNSLFLALDKSHVMGYCYGKSSDSGVLATISSLLRNVTTLAPEQGGFAFASADGEYAAAQCLGYLNETECSECLSQFPYRVECDSSLGEQVHLTSCYYHFEPYSFLEPPSAPPPGAAAPTPISHHTGSKTTSIAASVSIVGIIVLIALCIILVWCYKASKRPDVSERQVAQQISLQPSLMQTKAQVFSLQELEEATSHFHPDNKLGEGGYGSVYKGTLSRGEQVAVKKLASSSHLGRIQFLNEVNLITKVQHKNLIRLLGSCVEGSERILVYEYFPNKSLVDFSLFGQQDDGKTLDWPSRFGIVFGWLKGWHIYMRSLTFK